MFNLEKRKYKKMMRAWALYSINWMVVMGKESCSALFQRDGYHKWTRVMEEWIWAQRLKKLASLLCKLHIPHPPFYSDLVPVSCSSRKELSHKFISSFPWSFLSSNTGFAFIKGTNPCFSLKYGWLYVKDSIKCDEVTFTSELLHWDVITLHLALLWVIERRGTQEQSFFFTTNGSTLAWGLNQTNYT